MSTPEIVQGWFSDASEAAILPSEPNQSRAMLCRRKATANVATSMTAGDCVRSGLNTTQSIATDKTTTTAKQSRMPIHTGHPRSYANASAYAPAMTSWPYAKFTSLSTPKTSPIPTAMSA